MTECVECDGASVAKEDGALKSRLVKGRVEFTIQGAEGIQRIFPVIPDSVRLLRRLGAGAKDEVFTLPVRRMNP
jgi:hypothetical protein